MPRSHRLHVPGGVYHVILRGNHRQPIFNDAADREMLDSLVADSLARSSARAHAYCWMTNHIHLAVQVSDHPLGKVMQRIASQYARRLQWHIPTTGHLFERRYHAVLVDADVYLLRLVRYIHLNPVRAGLARDPAGYPWSGHRAYLGLAQVPWLTTEFVLRRLSADLAAARREYSNLIAQGGDATDSTQFCRGDHGDSRMLGTDEFNAAAIGPSAAEAHCDAGTLEFLVVDICHELGVDPAQLASRSRSAELTDARCLLAERALARGVANITSVARRLNRSHSSLCEALERRRRRRISP
jgi:REP element-mobilizing transposase RayT